MAKRENGGVSMVFLGTGGARFSMITQKRHTGGIRIYEPLQLQIDPGPGAIVYSIMSKLDPSKVQALLVSHCHPDHYSDAEVFLEAMTQGGTRKRGVLLASKSVISGNELFGPAISKYHRSLPTRAIEMSPGDKEDLGTVQVSATAARHSDPDTIGFRLGFPVGDVGYISDTEYFPELARQFEGVRVLILSVLRPRGDPWKGHLSTDDVITIVRAVKPEISVLTHFGMKMIFAGPSREAAAVQEESGTRVIAAVDNMKLSIDREIVVSRPERDLRRYLE
ncbi:MAG: MBL fold metallo-hydrolase [archaeon]